MRGLGLLYATDALIHCVCCPVAALADSLRHPLSPVARASGMSTVMPSYTDHPSYALSCRHHCTGLHAKARPAWPFLATSAATASATLSPVAFPPTSQP